MRHILSLWSGVSLICLSLVVLWIVRSAIPDGVMIKVNNHGNWEVVGDITALVIFIVIGCFQIILS